MARPYAEVIGDPIAHSKSPLIHNFWLRKLGIDAEYRATHVRADELEDYFKRRCGDAAWRGCNVTIPHKIATLALNPKADPSARGVGATNCVTPSVSGLLTSNTDVDGVAEAVKGGIEWDVCLIGSGGAARAALWQLANPGGRSFAHDPKRKVSVIARDLKRAGQLLEEFGLPGSAHAFADARKAMIDATLIINATSLGMAGQPAMPRKVIDALPRAYPDALVFDMVYQPLQTELLDAAARNRFHVVDGLTMLVGQAAKAFERFFSAQAPRKHDSELRELLIA